MAKGSIQQSTAYEGKQLLITTEHDVIVTTSGDSMEKAVGNLFQVMRKQVFQEIGRPIVQMEAKEVYFQDVKVRKDTEKFLFLFMPRERTQVGITAKITVCLKYLDIEKEEL